MREAFPFEQIPRYLLRDRDCIFGAEFRKDVKAMGIHEVFRLPARRGNELTWNV